MYLLLFFASISVKGPFFEFRSKEIRRSMLCLATTNRAVKRSSPNYDNHHQIVAKRLLIYKIISPNLKNTALMGFKGYGSRNGA